MMTRLLIVAVAFCASSAMALEYQHCRNFDTDDNSPFEEGYGDYGMPDVDGDSQETLIATTRAGELSYVSVGQMSWDAEDGVTVSRRGTTTTYSIKPEHGSYQLQVKVYKSERGVVLFKDEGERRYSAIGKIDCSSTQRVEDANIGDRNVKRTSFSRISKKARDRISMQDVGFEMGDGYYDVIATSYYKVYYGGKLQGYIVWYKLSYTEDPEYPEVELYFDRNGLRLTDPLW